MENLIHDASKAIEGVCRELVKKNPNLYIENGIFSESAVLGDAWLLIQGAIEHGFTADVLDEINGR